MSKLVELIGTSVYNVTVPGTGDDFELYKTLKAQESGISFRTEDDDVPVAPGWEYDAELEAYYDPNA